MTIETPDAYTVKFIFAQPNVFFIYGQAREGNSSYSAGTDWLCPSHYMKRYHIDFADNPSALEAEALAAGFGSWSDYYIQNRNWWAINPARPSVGPWLAKNAIGQTLFEMERNPYYYCVDSVNNQLPYVDTILHRFYSLSSELAAWAKIGEIDFQARGISYSDYADFKAHESTGGYRVIEGISSGHLALQLNLTTQTPRLRTFFQTQEVRIALSLAVDRSAMNTAIFDDLATPRQYSPVSITQTYPMPISPMTYPGRIPFLTRPGTPKRMVRDTGCGTMAAQNGSVSSSKVLTKMGHPVSWQSSRSFNILLLWVLRLFINIMTAPRILTISTQTKSKRRGGAATAPFYP